MLINNTATPIPVTYVYTLAANGCANTQNVVVTVNPKPELNGMLTNAPICDSTLFSFPATSMVSGTSFAWTRPFVAGILPATATGTGDINETPDNTTAAPISIAYQYTLSANGCTNNQSVVVTVNPKPVLAGALAQLPICDSTLFHYVPTSPTAATTFLWHRDTVSGIANAAASGTDGIAEILVNHTSNPLTVSYTYTLTANSCSNAQVVTVVVNPQPVFTSPILPAAICDSTLFTYTPTSATTGTLFTWTRDTVSGITNAYSSGSGDPNEVLVNTTPSKLVVTYVYTLTANGCSNIQSIKDTVKPKPMLAGLLTQTPICDSEMFVYNPGSPTAATIFYWSRPAISAIANSGSLPVQEWLVNTGADPVTVNYDYTLTANGCSNTQSVLVVVKPKPMLSSLLLAPATCDSTLFTYLPTSLTSGTHFAWSRDAVAGIANAANSGTDGVHEVLDNITISPVVVTYVYDLSANGCFNTQYITDTVSPTPFLNSTLAPPAICDSMVFSYTPTSTASGTSFAWTRAAVSGILPTTGSGTDNPNEALINTTPHPVVTSYLFTLTSHGCVHNQYIEDTVKPSPRLSSTLTPAALCDSTLFSYTPHTLTAGTTFLWSRAAVSGILNPPATGSDAINEILVNHSSSAQIVTYLYTLTAEGCSNTQEVKISVKPPLALTGILSDTVCSGAPYNYIAGSTTANTLFTWARTAVAGITPISASGTYVINEVLQNSTTTYAHTIYAFTLLADGCTAQQQLNITIEPPAPKAPIISTHPNSWLCLGTMFQNFGADTTPAAGTNYTWSAANAAIWATGNSDQYCLVNFKTEGWSTIYLDVNTVGYSCYNRDSFVALVAPNVNEKPGVMRLGNDLVCLENNEDAYQWGYDNASTLDSTILTGETNQNYYNNALDLINNYYWVITTHHSCTQKTYYNEPVKVGGNIQNALGNVTIYPNPNDGTFTVSTHSLFAETGIITITNTMGEKIAEKPFHTNQKVSFGLDAVPGFYFVNIHTPHGSYVGKIVIAGK